MAIVLPPSENVTLHRDRKLATWVVYAPKMAGMTVPIWYAVTDGYGRKVTIIAASREEAIARLVEFSRDNERKLSPNEAGTITTYGLYALISGAVLAGIGLLTKSPKLGYFGGVASVSGIAGVAAGTLIRPKLGDEQVLALPALGGAKN